MKNLIVLASGSGTTFDNLCYHCADGILQNRAKITKLVTNKKDISALDLAKTWGVEILFTKNLNEVYDFSPDLIILAGFISYFPVNKAYEGKILNIHPSLLPKFGGKGMYGLSVHEAVLSAGEEETGCTVHVVNENYDEGPILAQEKINISSDDTPESLQEKVKEVERALYPRIILECMEKSLN